MEKVLVESPEPGVNSSIDESQAFGLLQLPENSAKRGQEEIREYTNCLRVEEKNTPFAKLSDVKIDSRHGSARHPHSQQLPLTHDQFPAQAQQARLFEDPRRHKLFDEYTEVQRQNPDSHLARLGELAHYVFENGRPARVWTAGGEGSARVGLDPSKISIHGMCDCTYDDADILLLTESEHAAWSKASNPPKLVVIRDPEFSRRRPAKTTETWLREQERGAKSQKIWVDVQRLDRNCDDAAAEKTNLQDAIRQWRASQNKDAISLETPPMNLLNISDHAPGHWPEGLAKDYQLLFDAIAQCDGLIYQSLDERLPQLPEQDRGIGKATLRMFAHSDIQNCTQFRILAQRGACSSWHIDNVGVYTFIVLEGNLDNPVEEAEDVVKYWPVYPMHHMSAQKQHAARLKFAKEGLNWRPIPDGKIPVIALIRGDMLIQPPGTIHAPITLTNCFFLGGMAWRKSTLPQTLDIWYYLMKNEICTNEPLPRQSQVILDFIKVAVHDQPEDFGYREYELGEFDRICDEISGRVSRCGCSKACSLSTKCSCLMQGLKCGIRCHKGGTLHHTTCTRVDISSSAEKKRVSKRSLLKGNEDLDCKSNGTTFAQAKRRKRRLEVPIDNGVATTAIEPDDHSNNYFTEAVELVRPQRPETCSASSTGGTCDYTKYGRGVDLICKYCRSIVRVQGEGSQHASQRVKNKPEEGTRKKFIDSGPLARSYPTGIKFRLRPLPTTPGERDTDQMNKTTFQYESLGQLQNVQFVSSFGAPIGPSKVDETKDVCKADWLTATEPPNVANPYGLVPYEGSQDSLSQRAAQVMGDPRSFVPPEEPTPQPVKHKLQVNDSVISSFEPQTYPTLDKETRDLFALETPNLYPDPSAVTQQSPTNSSSTPQSLTDNSDLHYSSQSDIGDQFFKRELEDVDLLKQH